MKATSSRSLSSASGELDFPALYERAAAIRQETRLPAKSWVNGLKSLQPVL